MGQFLNKSSVSAFEMTDLDELERFREEWKREVAQRTNSKAKPSSGPIKTKATKSKFAPNIDPPTSSSTFGNKKKQEKEVEDDDDNDNDSSSESPLFNNGPLDYNDTVFSYHATAQLSNSSYPFTNDENEAIRTFESAVEREHQGKLADAIVFYRNAFKMNDNVDKLYREKWHSHHKTSLPPPVFSEPKSDVPKSIPTKNKTLKSEKTKDIDDEDLDTEKEAESLVGQLGDLTITPENNDELSPFSKLSVELIEHIFCLVADTSVKSFAHVLQTCKNFYEIGNNSPLIWKKLCLNEYPSQRYTLSGLKQVYNFENTNNGNDEEKEYDDEDEYGRIIYFNKLRDEEKALWNPKFPSWYGSWKKMYLKRPRVRFDGIYISTCNYFRPGRGDGWNTPIIIVTYYRYLRFFRDGSCISLLSTDEPRNVVPLFGRQNYTNETFKRSDNITIQRPQGIVDGTWEHEDGEGRILVTTEGSVDKYLFYLHLQIRSSGTKKHNKLKWIEFWSRNKVTLDRTDFNLKNDKPYYFLAYKYKN